MPERTRRFSCSGPPWPWRWWRSRWLRRTAGAGDWSLFRGDAPPDRRGPRHAARPARTAVGLRGRGRASSRRSRSGDGVVYAGSIDGHLYAIDFESGGLKWKYEAGRRDQVRARRRRRHWSSSATRTAYSTPWTPPPDPAQVDLRGRGGDRLVRQSRRRARALRLARRVAVLSGRRKRRQPALAVPRPRASSTARPPVHDGTRRLGRLRRLPARASI